MFVLGEHILLSLYKLYSRFKNMRQCGVMFIVCKKFANLAD